MMQVYVTYLIYRCQLDAEGGEFLLSVPRTKNLEQRALMHGWPWNVSDRNTCPSAIGSSRPVSQILRLKR